MEVISIMVDFILHVDKHLLNISNMLGIWAYVILFLVIFCETGLVVTPFLPGDSFLFATGVLAGIEIFDIRALIPLLIIAAISGDMVNYWIGKQLGDKIYRRGKLLFINKNHLDKAQAFYIKNGFKAIILARFVPIVRTFAPFVAGMSNMPYATFTRYNVIGAFIWVIGFVVAGYLFGTIPIIANNIGVISIIIVVISVVPLILEFVANRQEKKK